MSRLANWWRRYKLAIRGECKWEGCEEPAARAFDFCRDHVLADLRRYVKERERRRFDREAEVIAEGIRRANEAPVVTQPDPQPEQCREGTTPSVSDKSSQSEQCGGSGEG